jgi:hypothetical protein
MTVEIELQPDEERALVELADLSGRDLAGYIRQLLLAQLRTSALRNEKPEAAETTAFGSESLIDFVAIEVCAREVEGKRMPAIGTIRRMLSKIPDSMAQVVIEEREDRY